jgi:hypothetical protein
MGMGMDLGRVLEELRKELQHIDSAILHLERLQAKTRRRGRPPKPSMVRSEIKRDTSQGRRLYGRQSDS